MLIERNRDSPGGSGIRTRKDMCIYDKSVTRTNETGKGDVEGVATSTILEGQNKDAG